MNAGRSPRYTSPWAGHHGSPWIMITREWQREHRICPVRSALATAQSLNSVVAMVHPPRDIGTGSDPVAPGCRSRSDECVPALSGYSSISGLPCTADRPLFPGRNGRRFPAIRPGRGPRVFLRAVCGVRDLDRRRFRQLSRMGTSTTGLSVSRTTASATLPSSSRAGPLRPCVAITSSEHELSRAYSSSASRT